jgi:bifunctional non-homologous end joining protein LigD
VPVNQPGMTYDVTRAFALAVARLVEKVHGDLVVTTQDKKQRVGKVLIDWSQNHLTKTTVGAYSLRARPRPTVSTPVTWDEVADALDGKAADALSFETDAVLRRTTEHGDLFAPVVEVVQELPRLE